MKQLTRTQLLRGIATRTGLPQRAALDVIEALSAEIHAATDQGLSVAIPQLGRFGIKHSPARVGRNPMTGVPVDIPAKSKLTFRAQKRTS